MIYEFKTGPCITTVANIASMRRAIEAQGIKSVVDQDGNPPGMLLRDARPRAVLAVRARVKYDAEGDPLGDLVESAPLAV
jgi:hypothetical protein